VLGLYLQELPFTYDSAKFNREYLETVVGKSMQLIAHMSQTINDFRNFFRSDKEKVTFSVTEVIGQTLSLTEESFKGQQISIAVHPEGDQMTSRYSSPDNLNVSKPPGIQGSHECGT